MTNEKNKYKYESDYSIAKGIALDIPQRSRGSSRALAHCLSGDIERIRRAYRYCMDKEKSGSMGAQYEWIADNYYAFEKEYFYARKALARQRDVQLSFENLPRLYLMAKEYIKRIGRALDEDSCEAFAASLSAGETDCNFADYFSAELFCKCAVISLFAESSQSICEKNEERDIVRTLANLVTSLKYIPVFRFGNEVICSKTEKLLRQDPSNYYPLMDDATKMRYRKRVAFLAKKKRISEADVANAALSRAKAAQDERSAHIGAHLFYDKKSVMYFPLLFGISAALTLALLFVHPLLVILAFPVFSAVKTLLDFLYSLFVPAEPIFKLKLSQIPDTSPVLAVVTTLLCGKASDGEIFDRLERIYNANSGKNIYFGVLCDLTDSDSATTSSDEATIEYAKDRIDSLCAKYGDKFFLFVRHRVYSKSEKRFIAWERKRGAVIELVRFLKNEKTSFDTSVKSLNCDFDFEKIKYVITLDGDTNLSLDSVLELVGAMLHPLNRPVIDEKKKIVTSGYGIMQPRASAELGAAQSTPFTNLFCGEGGIDIYSGACFDLYQSLFSEGIFCGKGIFDKDAFYKVIDKSDAFPEDTILSHDILEGAALRCALLSDMELTDMFPKNELSYLKRQHRWVRGDVQNLKFLNKTVRDTDGKKFKNCFGALSRFKIFDNFRRHTSIVFSFLGVLLASFFPERTAFLILAASLLPYALPFVFDAARLFFKLSFGCASRRFFSKGVTTGIWQSFLRMLFNICFLAKNALSVLDAVLRSAYRMTLSKKNLLQWVTAKQAEGGKNTVFLYIQKNIFSALLGFLLFYFSPYGALKLIGIAWFLFPVVAYTTSREKKDSFAPDPEEKQKMLAFAKDIWRFFEDNVTDADNFLPPDNLQLFPSKILAHRTSPTNIGLYLACIVCARDFGFIDTRTMALRLRRTLDTIERLEKYCGHLYNWYDTKSLKILSPKYISSVDSGNFVACLIFAKEGILEYTNEDVSLLEINKTLCRLIDDTDFTPLYDKKRELFSQGLDFKDDMPHRVSGCYDIFMSEARITSYIACAKRLVGKKHWFSLGRLLVSNGGHIGLCSWTGTAFEYFMPALFLPTGKSSLSYEAFSFALYAQRQRSAKKDGTNIWGISESAFFSYDSEMNYQYKAHGIPLLALKRGLEKELVISPYSSFLSLCISRRASLLNLERIKRLFAYGEYGFYEAIDFTKSRTDGKGALIKSYMSHHLGMSFLALSNACFSNLVQKRFMRDEKMACARELLEEKIPVNAHIRNIKPMRDIPERIKRPALQEGSYFEEPDFDKGHIVAVSDGKLTAVIGQNGHMAIKTKKEEIIRRSNEKYELCDSLFSFIKVDGNCYSLTPLPNINPKEVRYGFYKSENEVRHEINFAGDTPVFASAAYTLSSFDSSVFRARLRVMKENEGEKRENIHCAFCFQPILSELISYEAHPAFSSLFIEAFYDERERILYFKRRTRSPKENPLTLAVALADADIDLLFDTRAQDVFLPKHSGRDYAQIFSRKTHSHTGACIIPFCRIEAMMKQKGQEYTCELLLCCAKTQSSAREGILLARNEDFDRAKKALLDNIRLLHDGAPMTKNTLLAEEKMLNAVFFCENEKGLGSSEEMKDISKNALWQHSVSGDLPIVCVRLGSLALCDKLSEYILAYKRLFAKKVFFDLVVLYEDEERYFSPCKSAILQQLESCKAREFFKRGGGGIFAVDISLCKDRGASILAASCVCFEIYSRSEECVPGRSVGNILLPIVRPQDTKKISSGEFPVYGGAFVKDGFCVDKSYELCVPYSHVITGENISTVLSANSLGYTFLKNSSLQRITPFENDALKEMNSERILLKVNGSLYDLCACSKRCEFTEGCARYYGEINEAEYEITVSVFKKHMAKRIGVRLVPGQNCEISLFFAVKPLMSHLSSDSRFCHTKTGVGYVEFQNPFSERFSSYKGFIFGFERRSRRFAKSLCDKAQIFTDAKEMVQSGSFAAVGFDVKLSQNCAFNCEFAVGAYASEKAKKCLFEILEKEGKAENVTGLIPDISCELENSTEDFAKPLSHMFNFWLPYQNSACRFLARSGFYQSGGAYGYRDQLQDCLTLMYSDSKRALSHIYRAAAHQFLQGDALHWWHPNFVDKEHLCYGIRTRCSDDYLFLPYVCSKYSEFTGNRSFFDTEIKYSEAPELLPGELEKYVLAKKSDVRESVYSHCIRALMRATTLLGEHGLCLIGSCDWSDGLSLVGKDGRGESVWLSMFLLVCIDSFLPICDAKEDIQSKQYLLSFSEKLRESIEKYGYDREGKRYIRGFYDDGEPFGAKECKECQIDILPQSFALFSGVGSLQRNYEAQKSAYELLYDDNAKIFRLFTPAFKDTLKDPGYIKGYVAGIRENGGQYTHAAVWGIMGFFEMARALYETGEDKKARQMQNFGKNVLYAINPAYRMSKKELASSYLAEPYCMAGDVYSNPEHAGRAGWTWYTGAAGWYWRTILRYVFGISIENVLYTPVLNLDVKYPMPCPELIDGAVLTLDIAGYSYSIKYVRREKAKIICDSSECLGAIKFQKGKHHIICEYS